MLPSPIASLPLLGHQKSPPSAELGLAGPGGGVRVTCRAGPSVARRPPYFPGPLGTRAASVFETRNDGGGGSLSFR